LPTGQVTCSGSNLSHLQYLKQNIYGRPKSRKSFLEFAHLYCSDLEFGSAFQSLPRQLFA
jgi:hypothetical protein